MLDTRYDLPLQPVSAETYATKYQLKDKTGKAVDADVDATFRRVAKALAAIEQKDKEVWEEKFYKVLANGCVPAGRIMANAGAGEYKPATSTINCTVSRKLDDSMEGILSALYDAGITLKAGCGIGYCFSTLRPKGAWVSGVGATTSGPMAFMDIFDRMCLTISSAGGRRGAQMATFHINHPDVLDFIAAKREDGRLRQFNMSVLVTDEFMEAVKQDKMWKLRFPISWAEFSATYSKFLILPVNSDSEMPDDLIWDTWPGMESDVTIKDEFGRILCKVYKEVKARDIWETIMKSTYDYAEPGVLFIDTVTRDNNNWWCETITASNPCGEQMLPPEGSCLLGSINLTHFVRGAFTDDAEFDWDVFTEAVRVFTRMLDNVVEINGLPVAGQRAEIIHKRRHGMGIFGLGSALAMLQKRYGSLEAVEFTARVMREIAFIGLVEGVALAKEKGPAPIMDTEFVITEEMLQLHPELHWDGYNVGDVIFGKVLWARYSAYLDKFRQDDYCQNKGVEALLKEAEKCGCRFTHHTSIAPTGTISLTFGNNVDSGIEPAFSHSYFRNITVQGKRTRQQQEVMSYELLLWRKLMEEGVIPQQSDLPDYFSVSDTVTPSEHVTMQAAAQYWIDSATSKTVNCPTDMLYEQFKDLYMEAFEKGCKGVTTFRFNPTTVQGVLVKGEDLEKTLYKFYLDDGSVVVVNGTETLEYEGEEHNAAMLYDSIKEGRYASGY